MIFQFSFMQASEHRWPRRAVCPVGLSRGSAENNRWPVLAVPRTSGDLLAASALSRPAVASATALCAPLVRRPLPRWPENALICFYSSATAFTDGTGGRCVSCWRP
jgi:hypothetical protein